MIFLSIYGFPSGVLFSFGHTDLLGNDIIATFLYKAPAPYREL
jgi:hypothetical protein